MLTDYFSNMIGEKWEAAKYGFYSNTMQIITLAYVCYLIYFAMNMYFNEDKSKIYSKAFMYTAMYIVARTFGSVVWGV